MLKTGIHFENFEVYLIIPVPTKKICPCKDNNQYISIQMRIYLQNILSMETHMYSFGKKAYLQDRQYVLGSLPKRCFLWEVVPIYRDSLIWQHFQPNCVLGSISFISNVLLISSLLFIFYASLHLSDPFISAQILDLAQSGPLCISILLVKMLLHLNPPN